MARRPETIETVMIVLELLRRLPRIGTGITVDELHQQIAGLDLKRNIRTTQRLMKTLSRHFDDIELDDRTKPYGYRWKEKSRGLALPMLTEQESLLLNLAQQQLNHLLPASLVKSMDGFFRQARTNLGTKQSAKLEKEWLSKVRVVSTTQPLLPPVINPDVFEQVSNALYANQWLSIEYANSQNKHTTADVMPLGLAQQGPRMYLVCRFKGYDNERSLALHRIRSAKASTLTFTRPKDFDLQKYDADGRFGFGEGRRIKLAFNIDKDAGQHLLETPLSEDQKVKDEGDYYRITATVVDTAQLDWWLRGFGDSVDGISKRRVL